MEAGSSSAAWTNDIFSGNGTDPVRHGDELGEGPLPLELRHGDTEHLPFHAAIEQALPAGRTLIAVNRRIEADALARGEVPHVAARPLDDAGGLVAHDRLRQPPAGLTRRRATSDPQMPQA
jgi:hypothetical protein